MYVTPNYSKAAYEIAMLTISKINMGIAMRMAALMRLHREETYALQNPSKEMVIAAESARRTLWMLHSKSSHPCTPDFT